MSAEENELLARWTKTVRSLQMALAAPNAWEVVKDFIVPLATPVAVALVGIGFGVLSERRQNTNARIERQAEVMRQVMVSQDRRETAFLLAVDYQLAIHLMRFAICRQEEKPTDFDEEAAFFFYGLHRAALVNLMAAKGNLLFPRLWMEEAFQKLTTGIVTNILGAQEIDPSVSPMGEAVIYKYFGGQADSESSATGGGKSSTGRAALMDFHRLLTTTNTAPLYAEEAAVLKSEFEKFRKRLQADEIKRDEIVSDIFALAGLFDSSFAYIFADWYSLTPDELPGTPALGPNPPKLFLEVFRERREEATNAWERIRELVNP